MSLDPNDESDAIWLAIRENAKARRKERQASAPAAIERAEAAGLLLHRFSDQHIRVGGPAPHSFDWWPSTGRWQQLHGRLKGFGVESLIKAARQLTLPLVDGKDYRDGRGHLVTVGGRTKEYAEWAWSIQGDWYEQATGRAITYGHKPGGGPDEYEHTVAQPGARDLKSDA